MFSFDRKWFSAGNSASPALRMLMEKARVSKREAPIFAAGVADLSSLSVVRLDVARGLSSGLHAREVQRLFMSEFDVFHCEIQPCCAAA